MPHFPEYLYYPTIQSISHLTNRGRAWVRKNLEMMIVVAVRSLQSSSVGLCIIIHTIQYYVWGVFWAAYLLQIKSEIANKKFILGSQRSHQLCSTHLCPEMRIWRLGTQLGIYTAVCMLRVWCVVLACWQLQCCCCCCCCIRPPCLWFMLCHPPHQPSQIN